MKDAILHAPMIHRYTKNLTPDEEAMIASAEMPLKLPISDELLWETKDKILNNRKVLIQGVCIALAAMVVGLLLGAVKYGIALGLTAAVFGAAALIMHRNAKIDESATMMYISVHHTNNNFSGNYAVCYLPDGKYEFYLSNDKSYINTLLVVQFNRYTTWQAMFRTSDENEMPVSTLGLTDDTDEAESAAEQPAADSNAAERT